MLSTHAEMNQISYSNDAITHSELGLDSTLFLAYRDLPILIKKYLLPKLEKTKVRVLDVGCGAGLSTELIAKMLEMEKLEVDLYGLDVSQDNLELAKNRLPSANFIHMSNHVDEDLLKNFDLVICNFVLVENTKNNMFAILKNIHNYLSTTGVAIITNCASAAYNRDNKWYTFNNNFTENTPQTNINGKDKFAEDQPIKVEVFSSYKSPLSFTFFDFFHSGAAYRKAYEDASLELLETHKPIGKESDNIAWLDEAVKSPYKIHVVAKMDLPQKELRKVFSK
jgi:2-polyprenyl-3-methyl-5-hydroxy-6-metoxy-1,4-benzoquinol methylase